MSSNTIIGIEFGLVSVLVIGFGLYELWKLRRDKKK